MDVYIKSPSVCQAAATLHHHGWAEGKGNEVTIDVALVSFFQKFPHDNVT